MTTQELTPLEAYIEARNRLHDLIEFVQTMPVTRKRDTTLSYLLTAETNLLHLARRESEK